MRSSTRATLAELLAEGEYETFASEAATLEPSEVSLGLIAAGAQGHNSEQTASELGNGWTSDAIRQHVSKLERLDRNGTSTRANPRNRRRGFRAARSRSTYSPSEGLLKALIKERDGKTRSALLMFCKRFRYEYDPHQLLGIPFGKHDILRAIRVAVSGQFPIAKPNGITLFEPHIDECHSLMKHEWGMLLDMRAVETDSSVAAKQDSVLMFHPSEEVVKYRLVGLLRSHARDFEGAPRAGRKADLSTPPDVPPIMDRKRAALLRDAVPQLMGMLAHPSPEMFSNGAFYLTAILPAAEAGEILSLACQRLPSELDPEQWTEHSRDTLYIAPLASGIMHMLNQGGNAGARSDVQRLLKDSTASDCLQDLATRCKQHDALRPIAESLEYERGIIRTPIIVTVNLSTHSPTVIPVQLPYSGSPF